MTSRPGSRRTRASTASVLFLLLLITAAGTFLAGCSGDDGAGSTSGATPDPGTTPGSTPSASAPATASTSPGAGVTASATGAAARSVKVGRPAALQPDVIVRVVGVRKVNLTAEGAGETAGPGAAVKLRVGNASARSIDLGELAVNAHYGPGRTPAAPNTTNGDGGRELAGSLEAGRSRTGTYYFTVPSKSFATLDVEVSSGDSPYVITFVHG